MEQQEQHHEEITIEQLVGYIFNEIQEGADRAMITNSLVSLGAKRTEIEPFVDQVYFDVIKAAQAAELSTGALLGGLGGGLLAALAGGLGWGLFVAVTGHEIGYAAWGIGVLTGFSVVLFAGGRKGVPLQAMAALFSVLGIAIGKYMTLYHATSQAVLSEYGANAAANLSPFSTQMFYFFLQMIGRIVSPYDAVWVLIALVTAWCLPRE